MAGFNDFEEVSTEETLHVMSVEYEEQWGDPIVHLWCRTEDNEERWVEVEGHQPSFFVHEEAYTRRVKNHNWVEGAETHGANGRWQTLDGRPLTRVFTQLPWHVGGKNDKKGLREYFDSTWEADVFFTTRFLIDNGIKTHFTVDTEETWEPQALKGDYRVNVEDIQATDADWKATPRMVTVDIEVESPDGFPEPDEAKHPVTAITAHDNYSDAYTVWVLKHEGWPYGDTEVSNIAIENRPDGTNIEDVHVYDDESTMLDDFNEFIEERSPDLLSGWNSSASDNGKAFDYPYLINRCKNLNTYSYEDWSPLGQVWDSHWGPRIKGVEAFDMMKAYEKTQWSEPKDGWGLESISRKELPEDMAKLEIEDIDDAWRDAPGTFLEYNIRDVQAVIEIDDRVGVLDLYQNLRKLTGAQYGDCHNNIDLLDQYILRFARERGVALPTNTEPTRGWFYGGYVFEPELGRHPNAVYPDVWSEYPNAFRTCNMSPETIIGTEEDLEESEYTEEDCRWSYIDTRPDNVKKESDPEYEKCYYLKPEIKTGFMNEVVDHVMTLKDDYDGTELYGPVKQVVNSVWGVYGDSDSYGKGYRLFDWRVAESITLYGRKVIQYSAQRFVDEVNNIKDERGLDGRKAYQVGGDTDSVMTSIPFMPADTREEQSDIVDIAIDACDRVNDSYDEFAAKTFNSNGDYIELEIESYAPWLFVPKGVTKEKAKKRYAEIIAWEEGEWFDPPEFSVTGIDIVRSDRAVATRDIAQEVIETILRVDDEDDARNEAYATIKEVVEDIEDGERPNSYIARPKGMSKRPEEYGSPDQTPLPTYRGAKYANQNFDWENMDSGAKPQLLYLERVRGDWPRTYSADTKEDGRQVDAVAVEKPDKVPDEFVVDTDKMIEKVLEDPLTPILEAMHWSFDDAVADTDQGSLAQFM